MKLIKVKFRIGRSETEGSFLYGKSEWLTAVPTKKAGLYRPEVPSYGPNRYEKLLSVLPNSAEDVNREVNKYVRELRTYADTVRAYLQNAATKEAAASVQMIPEDVEV